MGVCVGLVGGRAVPAVGVGSCIMAYMNGVVGVVGVGQAWSGHGGYLFHILVGLEGGRGKRGGGGAAVQPFQKDRTQFAAGQLFVSFPTGTADLGICQEAALHDR